MRSGFSGMLLVAALALVWPWAAAAQSDEASLGDLARSLRKSKAQQPQARPVIDNDNLAQAMEDVKKLKPANRTGPRKTPSGSPASRYRLRMCPAASRSMPTRLRC